MLLLLQSSLFKILFIALWAPGRKTVNSNKSDHPGFKEDEKRPNISSLKPRIPTLPGKQSLWRPGADVALPGGRPGFFRPQYNLQRNLSLLQFHSYWLPCSCFLCSSSLGATFSCLASKRMGQEPHPTRLPVDWAPRGGGFGHPHVLARQQAEEFSTHGCQSGTFLSPPLNSF